MQIYYGGHHAIETPKITQEKYAQDFGSGFYCTQRREDAMRWALRYDIPTVSIYDFKQNDQLKVLHFEKMTEEWLAFIVDCRNGKKHDYDKVTGRAANDQVYNYIADYISGVLTKEQFWILAKFKHPTHQINFCTENALKCLTFI